MRRSIAVMVLLAVAAAAAVFAYQAAARDRDYRALMARGDAALRAEETFGAIEAYSGAIALRGDSMIAHLRRAETYQRRGDRGDLDQALRDLRTAASLDPAATRPLEELGDVLYQLRRYEQATDAYSRCLRIDDRSATVSYKLALAHYGHGNLDAAISTLGHTLLLDAGMANGHYLLGMCLRDRRQDADAVRSFEKAASLAPGLLAAREELAELYASAGRRSDQLEQLQIAAALDRDHVERQVAVGLAQARAGRAELAVLTLGQALERSPDQPLIYGALGRIWLDIAQARNDPVDLSKAIEALGRAASSPAATSDVLTLYGRALLRDGQIDLAERTLMQATARYPIEPTALFWYAAAAERQAHLEAARRALVDYHALAGDDQDSVARATRIAAMSLRLNDPQAAAEWIRRGLEKDAGDAALLALARRVR